VRMLPLSPPNGGLNTDFLVFRTHYTHSVVIFVLFSNFSPYSADRAESCTVNFSDVGTAHHSRTVSLR